MEEKICRLCLQTINGSYQTIGQSLKDTLKLNMNISKDAVKCSGCTNNLEVFFKFKSACDHMGKVTLPSDLKEDVKIEITDNLVSPRESKHEVKCSFCTKTSRREFLTSLSESKEHTFLVDVLKDHIPKLNINITEELLTCDTCLDALQDVFSFIMQCFDVEEKINKYTGIKGTDDEGHIDLKDVQLSICETAVKLEIESGDVKELGDRSNHFQEGCAAQAEAEIKSEKEIDDPDIFIKTEEVDIKSEDSDCDSLQEPSTIIETDDGFLNISVLKSQRRYEKCVNRHELTFESCAVKTTNTTQHKLSNRSTDHLKRHKLLHKNSSNIMMFKCELCPYKTKRHYHLNQHKLVHKSTSELTMFKCELCSYETKYQNNLKPHQLIHKSASELVMFKCELCPYETKYKSTLKKHRLNHKRTSELTMFKCELCPYETKHQNNLKGHRLTVRMRQNIRVILKNTS